MMGTVEQFTSHMRKAAEYHKDAQWQEKLRELQEALLLCEQPGFPDAQQRAQQVLFDLGGIRRRFGQHDSAIETLQQALRVDPNASSVARARILGELGVVYRHGSDFRQAKDVFQEQFNLSQGDELDAQMEACRAIGNLGMTIYNLSQQARPQDEELLSKATEHIESRIARTRHLQHRLAVESPGSRNIPLMETWETIGQYRLTLCLVAAGKTKEAVEVAEEARSKEVTIIDPTVKAFSRYFYGNTLWADGRREDALRQWNPESGICSPAIAMCKEPATEFLEYLQRLVSAGVDLNSYDEQGFSALDYATLSDTNDAQEMIRVIIAAFRSRLTDSISLDHPQALSANVQSAVEVEIALRVRQAQLRKTYRFIFQEQLRPQLKLSGAGQMVRLRRSYAKLLSEDSGMAAVLDDFRCISFNAFQRHGRLPIFGEISWKQDWFFDNKSMEASMEDVAATTEHIVFLSYRWIGRAANPPVAGPDDWNHTQWQRMNNAMSAYLECHPEVDASNLYLWLDYACIDQVDQQRKARGVDSLPLCVTLCDAMISLVDDQYYTRAWCSVECLLIRELVRSYTLHEWWEHVPEGTLGSSSTCFLRKGGQQTLPDVRDLVLTDEKADRPKIEFMVRQSKLLGKANT